MRSCGAHRLAVGGVQPLRQSRAVSSRHSDFPPRAGLRRSGSVAPAVGRLHKASICYDLRQMRHLLPGVTVILPRVGFVARRIVVGKSPTLAARCGGAGRRVGSPQHERTGTGSAGVGGPLRRRDRLGGAPPFPDFAHWRWWWRRHCPRVWGRVVGIAVRRRLSLVSPAARLSAMTRPMAAGYVGSRSSNDCRHRKAPTDEQRHPQGSHLACKTPPLSAEYLQ